MVLAVENLLFRRGNSDDFSVRVAQLHIAVGEQVLLYGPSGCGKSTLLSLLAGILAPQQGSIVLAGEQMVGQPMAVRDRLRADHLGVIFQAFNLLPYLSALDNVLLSAIFTERRSQPGVHDLDEAEDLLCSLGLDESLIARPAWQLSFGQQQRVAAARALFGAPALVIADEPTSALDNSNRDALLSLLGEQCARRDSALLMVSHDADIARHFSRLLNFAELDQGAGQ